MSPSREDELREFVRGLTGPELEYICKHVCPLVGQKNHGGHAHYTDPDFEPFDPDELGLDPELDAERY